LKADKNSMLLYVVTDRTWLGKNSLTRQVEETIRAGATFVQLREKELDFNEFVAEAKKIKAVTDRYHISFVINDSIPVALAVEADGVHVGQSDMAARDVRALLGKDKILGVSVQTVEQAVSAEENGADYLGVGAVFSTSTKPDAREVSFTTLQAICRAVSIPVVAIGGISEKNILELKGSGVDGVAVISAIFAKPDVRAAAKTLCELSKEMVTP
jgi:thiamine-phosphate pyrophosphorylase